MLARASGLDLLLFPELAALTTVVVAVPAHSWARSPRLLVLTPTLTGAVGIALGRQFGYGPLAVGLVVALSLMLIRLLRSPVMPALSAGLLPLALGIHSWIYPLALVPGTFGLALLALLRRHRAGERALVDGGSAPPQWPPLRRWLLPLVLFLVGALLLVRWLGSPLVFYPPLLVIAWETLAHGDHCPWRGRPIALLVATTAAATIGFLLVRWLGPLPLTTLLVVLAVALLLDRLRLTCPPAFAVALLPFVVHGSAAALPLHVLLGTLWLLLVAQLMLRRWPGAVGGLRGRE
ncbi:MAG: hypothetical protein VKJ05_03675 [Synechococcaceae cyanobacterium]|nr:hypothetical protein [Synechococcaceae cyanobacterium]